MGEGFAAARRERAAAPQAQDIAAYGPGDSLLDHTPQEHIHLDEFTRSIRVLEHALGMLAGELAGCGRHQGPGIRH